MADLHASPTAVPGSGHWSLAIAAAAVSLAILLQLPWLLTLGSSYLFLAAYAVWTVGWLVAVVALALALTAAIGARKEPDPRRRVAAWILSALVPVIVFGSWMLVSPLLLTIP